jgi:hypothetical protein
MCFVHRVCAQHEALVRHEDGSVSLRFYDTDVVTARAPCALVRVE